MRIPKIYPASIAILAVFAVSACSDGGGTGNDLDTQFSATLTGAAERPNAVTTTATGTSTVTINDDAQTLTFSINVTGLTSPTLAHIHVGTTSEAGPIAVNLLTTAPATGPFTGVLASGTRSTTDVTGGETFATLVAKIRAGNTYVNLHTVTNPGGEIRGQLVAQ